MSATRGEEASLGGKLDKKASEDDQEITIKPDRSGSEKTKTKKKNKIESKSCFHFVNSEGQAVQGVRRSAQSQQNNKLDAVLLQLHIHFYIFYSLSSTGSMLGFIVQKQGQLKGFKTPARSHTISRSTLHIFPDCSFPHPQSSFSQLFLSAHFLLLVTPPHQ